jgi:hypothetical protein
LGQAPQQEQAFGFYAAVQRVEVWNVELRAFGCPQGIDECVERAHVGQADVPKPGFTGGRLTQGFRLVLHSRESFIGQTPSAYRRRVAAWLTTGQH